MIICLDGGFWTCLCWVMFCSLISVSSLDGMAVCCLFFWHVLMVCSEGMLVDVRGSNTGMC